MTKTVKDVKRPNPKTPVWLRRGHAARWVHISITPTKDGRVIRGSGKTYDRRRNENKRLNRQADIRWRVSERAGRA